MEGFSRTGPGLLHVMLGFREILLILVVFIVVLYSRSFNVVGIRKSLGLAPTTPTDEIRIGASWLADQVLND